ncbi:23793_t:CDS:2, partial [Cetraspora pellucida]
DAIKNSFPIDISSKVIIEHFRYEIWKKKQNAFSNIDDSDLKLWKVSIPPIIKNNFSKSNTYIQVFVQLLATISKCLTSSMSGTEKFLSMPRRHAL